MNDPISLRPLQISNLDINDVFYLFCFPNKEYQVCIGDKLRNKFHFFTLEETTYKAIATKLLGFPTINLYEGVTLTINPKNVAHTVIEDDEKQLHIFFTGKYGSSVQFPVYCSDDSALKWHVCFQVWDNFVTYNQTERRLDSDGKTWEGRAKTISSALIKTIPECKRAHFFHPPLALQKPQFD